jgi:hypothetical protein
MADPVCISALSRKITQGRPHNVTGRKIPLDAELGRGQAEARAGGIFIGRIVGFAR